MGLRLGVGLGRRFGVLLLLHEDLVVQELELGRVPVDSRQNQIKRTKENMTLYMVKMRAAQCSALIN